MVTEAGWDAAGTVQRRQQALSQTPHHGAHRMNPGLLVHFRRAQSAAGGAVHPACERRRISGFLRSLGRALRLLLGKLSRRPSR